MKKVFIFVSLCGCLMLSSVCFSETESQDNADQQAPVQEEQTAEKDNETGGSPLNILFLPVKAFSKLGEHVSGAGKDGSSFMDVLGENVSQGYKSQERETNLTVIR